MSDAIEVHIQVNGETHRVGLCRYLAKRRGQSTLFEYADGWLDNPKGFAIDPANLPRGTGPFTRTSDKSALPGALRDTAPDRWGQMLVRRAFRKQGIERTLSEIDYLLAISDRTRIGALRYRREGEENFDHDLGGYRIPPLIQLPALLNAADAVHDNSETADDLRLLLNEGSPLGGARPKSVVQDRDGSLAIAKFPKPDDTRSIPHGEVLAMTLARQAGLTVADARIEIAAGRPVSVIKRFDRAGDARVPFISAMTLLGAEDGDDASYTDISEVIRMYSSQPTADLHELWRRIVFNVLASNLDDHLRNHAFLYDGQGWRLSPAYDLNPVPIEEKARELSVWISEEGPDASLDIALRVARFFALDDSEAESIIAEVSDAIGKWRSQAVQLRMTPSDIAAYASAFAQGSS